MESFTKMLNAQLILLVYMAVGMYCMKIHLIDQETKKKLVDLILKITLPCMIFNSFNDPNPARLPKTASGAAVPVYDFCRDIIDATADTVCAFKPQFAYFAAMRELDALERLTAYIHERHPGIPVILDAKRGDPRVFSVVG